MSISQTLAAKAAAKAAEKAAANADIKADQAFPGGPEPITAAVLPTAAVVEQAPQQNDAFYQAVAQSVEATPKPEKFPYWESPTINAFFIGDKRVVNRHGRFYGESEEEIRELEHFVKQGVAIKIEDPNGTEDK